MTSLKQLNLFNFDFLEELKNLNPPVITAEDFFARNTKELCYHCKQTINEISVIRHKIASSLLNHSFRSTSTINNVQSWQDFPDLVVPNSNNKFISTGYEKIDYILGGGYPIGQITEIRGSVESGKTQLIIAAAVASAKRGNIVYIIDTKNGVQGSRILEFVNREDIDGVFPPDYESGATGATGRRTFNVVPILERIKIIRVFDFWNLLDAVAAITHEGDADLICIDCLHTLLGAINDPLSFTTAASTTSSSSRYHGSGLQGTNHMLNPLLAQLHILLRQACSHPAAAASDPRRQSGSCLITTLPLDSDHSTHPKYHNAPPVFPPASHREAGGGRGDATFPPSNSVRALPLSPLYDSLFDAILFLSCQPDGSVLIDVTLAPHHYQQARLPVTLPTSCQLLQF